MSASDAILVQPGMEVYDKESKRVGQVKTVVGGGFQIGDAKGHDLFVPRDAVAEVSETERRVDLTIAAGELAALGQEGMAP